MTCEVVATESQRKPERAVFIVRGLRVKMTSEAVRAKPRFAIEFGKEAPVEWCVMRDHDRIADECGELRTNEWCGRGVNDVSVGDEVNPRRLGRNRLTGVCK